MQETLTEWNSEMEAVRQTLVRKGRTAQTVHGQKNGLGWTIVGNEEMNEQERTTDSNQQEQWPPAG